MLIEQCQFEKEIFHWKTVLWHNIVNVLMCSNTFTNKQGAGHFSTPHPGHFSKQVNILSDTGPTNPQRMWDPNRSIKKASTYIVSSPQDSSKHFTLLTDLFTQTPSRLLWRASSHMLQLMREGCSFTYPPLSGTHLHSWVNWSYVEWKHLPKHLNATAQDSNHGSHGQVRSSTLEPLHYMTQ